MVEAPRAGFARLWVERPGQDLNLRGVTQRFSRPPPYRARRPGQPFILKTRVRISVPTPEAPGGTLKAGAALGSLMQILAELFPRRTEATVALEAGATGGD